jgi:hypothetical protein
MTTRRWMIAVLAVAGVLAIGIELGRRRGEHLGLVAYHAELGRYDGYVFGDGVVPRSDPRTRERVITSLAKIDHHEQMAEKCRYAARYPWLLIEPDSPEPV